MTGGGSLMVASLGVGGPPGAGLPWWRGGYGNCGAALYGDSVDLDELCTGGACVGE